jgi:iron complex outermembrane receptor protein
MRTGNRAIGLVGMAVAAAVYGSTAGAQQAPAPDGGLEEILVTARSEQALDVPTSTGSRLGLTPLELPSSVATVSGDAVRARGDLTIAEAVSRAPGITNASNAGDGGTALAARGFVGQGSVLQLVDGIRQFPVAGSITFPSDPWNVERIEVLTGPASVLYGQGALGGAVNVVTKRPGDRPVVDLEASFGSQQTMHLAAGAGGPLTDTLGYRLDASYRQSDGWVDRGDSESIALGGTLEFAPTEALRITAHVDYADVEPMRYWGTPLVAGRLDERIRRRNYNVADAVIDYRDDRQSVVVDWTINDSVSIRNFLYRIASKRQWFNLELYCWVGADGECPNGGGGGTPGAIFRNSNLGIIQDNEQYGDQATVTIRSSLANGRSNDLVIGFDVNYIDLTYSNNFAFAEQADEVDPFSFAPGLLENAADTLPRYLTRTSERSIFLENRLELTDRLSIVGGARYEEDDVRRRNHVYTNGTSSGTVNAFPGGATKKTFDDFTWRIGAVYRPSQRLSFYGQYATGVDPVGTLTTFTTNAVQFAFSNARGNQIEAGVKGTFLDGMGSATLAVYEITKKDLTAQRVTNGPIEQIGEQSSRGIEASVSFRLPAGFGIELNGTLLDAEYDRFLSGNVDYAGKTPPDVPEQAGNLWLTWEGHDSLRAQAGVRYVGRRYSNQANTFRVPGYTVVDAGLSYAFSDTMAVDVRGHNLFDEVYAISTYDNEQWVLGRPRAFEVVLRARF